jgi:hypothetical protein
MSLKSKSREVVPPPPGPSWEDIADTLADAFAHMRKQNGAAFFPVMDGIAWYEAIKLYENKKHPMVETTSSFVIEFYPGRG